MSDDLSRLRIDQSAKAFIPKKRKAYLYLILGTVLLLLAAVLYATGILRPAVAVNMVTVSRVYPTQTYSLLNASGYVVAQRKAAVASKITGRLVALHVEEGTPVRQGEIVAVLEDNDVLAARAQALANLDVAESQLLETQADMQEASRNYRRKKELLARGVLSQAEYDLAEARYHGATARDKAAQAAVAAAKAALVAADVALEYTRIRAPFNAVVLTKNADVGDIVTPIGAAAEAKAAVVTIADMGSLMIEADVSEANVAQVRAGQPCEIQMDAFPADRLRGEIHMIVPTADRTKASILVKVKFLDPDLRILPEMSAKVSFLSRPIGPNDRTPRTAVPQSALRKNGSRVSVFRIEGNRVVELPIRTGMALDDLIEVTDGLTAGDRIVNRPPSKLDSGSRIKITEK